MEGMQPEKKGESQNGKSQKARARQFWPQIELPELLEPVDDDAESVDLLSAMRAVVMQPASCDRGRYEKLARRMYTKKPLEFGMKLADMDKAAANRPSEKDKSRDIGTEKCVALAEGLIAKLVEKQRAEDREFAKRPDAAQVGATLQKTLREALAREEKLVARVKELEATMRVG